MKNETFFNSMLKDFNTKDGRELAILDELRELMTEQKHNNPEFYKNIIFLCWNYLQELSGIKDENGDYILQEIITPAIENKPQAIESNVFNNFGIDRGHFQETEIRDYG
ncbi:MAG: hypothetical protein MJ066_05605 [Clostridia bacterium]|nr:hypothetical protein [Clostridia bacterium]